MMITTAPIRGVAADVQFHTASAQKEFWAMMAKGTSGYQAFPSEMHDHIVQINRAMSRSKSRVWGTFDYRRLAARDVRGG